MYVEQPDDMTLSEFLDYCGPPKSVGFVPPRYAPDGRELWQWTRVGRFRPATEVFADGQRMIFSREMELWYRPIEDAPHAMWSSGNASIFRFSPDSVLDDLVSDSGMKLLDVRFRKPGKESVQHEIVPLKNLGGRLSTYDWPLAHQLVVANHIGPNGLPESIDEYAKLLCDEIARIDPQSDPSHGAAERYLKLSQPAICNAIAQKRLAKRHRRVS